MGDSFTRRKESVLCRHARRCSAVVKGESKKVSRVCCDLNKIISDHWEVCVWGKESNYKSSQKTFVFGLGQTDFEINVDYTHVHSNIYNSQKMAATQCPFTRWIEWIN